MADRILIVEDSDAKFRNVEQAVLTGIGNVRCDLQRAATILSAEAMIEDGLWTLVVLDVSMNITSSTLGGSSGGHATLGGMDVIERMYHLGIETPTVVVTAFDAFQATDNGSGPTALVDLNYIRSYGQKMLKADFLGCIRYGEGDWAEALARVVHKRIAGF